HHPMTRTFGKPTNGAFGLNINQTSGEWSTGLTEEVAFTPPDWNNILNRVSIPVDEEVWLTPEGVANGEDDVVNKAIEWINNLVYPHNITCDTSYYSPGGDEIQISTIIENPNLHQLSARGYIHNLDDVLIDSLELTKQTFNSEGEIWIGNKIAPAQEDFYKVSVTAFDQTATTSFTLPNVTRFTTAGPVMIDSLIVTYNPFPRTFTVKAIVKNYGQTSPVKNLQIFMSTEDSSVTYLYGFFTVDSLAAQQITLASGSYTVRVDTNLFSKVFHFKFDISSGDWPYWQDEFDIPVGVEGEELQPLAYKLEQNYPNPFNPTTTIQYSIKERTPVQLVLYDILGREVEVLVNEEQVAGYYKVNFNAANLASGIYFYRLKAGSFVETKKMLLIK
ncbi:MAG: T9SS type A sorting domain-containing protein, partial [Ignavibacteriaceae bacterium]|nr:T9SS type A sorting domain-containing protein [Ignavibacteriaceae bacterium]